MFKVMGGGVQGDGRGGGGQNVSSLLNCKD